jgi:hypothetical protein
VISFNDFLVLFFFLLLFRRFLYRLSVYLGYAFNDILITYKNKKESNETQSCSFPTGSGIGDAQKR